MISQVRICTDKEYGDTWYLDFYLEDNNGRVFNWSYSSHTVGKRTYVDLLPQDYTIDDLDFFEEVVMKWNWG